LSAVLYVERRVWSYVCREMAARLEGVCKARAQVMSRDQGTRLWRPLHGGGMSLVELARVPPADDDVIDHGVDRQRYYIIGRKDTDVNQTVPRYFH